MSDSEGDRRASGVVDNIKAIGKLGERQYDIRKETLRTEWLRTKETQM